MNNVTSVEAAALELPLARPISSALGVYPHIDCTVVRVHTDAGHIGTGFTACLGGKASGAIVHYIDHELAPAIIGQDVLQPELLWHHMWGPNKARQRAGLGVWALSAVDIAIWDCVGKAAGLPLHTLLGGYQQSVPVYGSGGWHSLSDQELVDECTDFARLGISAYKYKIGTDRDRERTALLRREMGPDFVLLADANQKVNVREALESATMLAEYGVAWIEEPVVADSTDDLAAVARSSAVPTAAGENNYFRWGFRELCERRAADYLQPDIGRCGGVTEFRKIAALADSFGVSLTSHLWHELSISVVGAARSGWACEYVELIPTGALTRSFVVVDGHLAVPEVPGHGVEFTADAMSRYRVP
jgi:L-alanine-DL-glutamate epimerase-like enolase superfamily enzyme